MNSFSEKQQSSLPRTQAFGQSLLINTEPDWDQDGAEATVQEEEAVVQNSPPERSRSRDSTRSRSRERVATAAPIPVEGPRPSLSARNPLILTPAGPGYPTIRHDRAGVWQLVAAQQSGSARYLQGGPLQQRLRQSHCQSARRSIPTNCLQQRG